VGATVCFLDYSASRRGATLHFKQFGPPQGGSTLKFDKTDRLEGSRRSPALKSNILDKKPQ